jgi:hypothetical protein
MHKECENCRWEKFPECLGTKMADGRFMNIENLRVGFQCGQKDDSEVTDFSIIRKSALELKIDDLQEQINNLKTTN